MSNQWGALKSPSLRNKEHQKRKSKARAGKRKYSPEQQALRDKYPELITWIRGRPVGCWLGGDRPLFCVHLSDPSQDCKYLYRPDEYATPGQICLLVDIDDDLLRYVHDIMNTREKSRTAIGGWNK